MSLLAGADWSFDGIDGKHAIWRCRACRRFAVTLAGNSPSELGRCMFCFPATAKKKRAA